MGAELADNETRSLEPCGISSVHDKVSRFLQWYQLLSFVESRSNPVREQSPGTTL